jgi:aspartyl protease family protein
MLLAATTAMAILNFAEVKEAWLAVLGLSAAEPEAAAAAVQVGAGAGGWGGRALELTAGAFGHYRAQAEINGRPVEVLIDTGAALLVLSHADAERAGLQLRPEDYTQRVSTANGATRVAPLTLDRVSIGDIGRRNVEAAVAEPGKLSQSLLGMSFLGRLQRVDIRAGVLVLQD